MLQDIFDGKIQSLFSILKILSEISDSVTPPSEGILRNLTKATFWEFISLEQFDQGGWFYFYLYSFLDRFQKYNNYYSVTCKFSSIKWQTCLHLQFVSQFFNIQWSIYPYLPGMKHLYLICILSVWLVIDWWSLLWSLVHICWILALKVDPIWKRGSKKKIFPKRAIKILFFYCIFW